MTSNKELECPTGCNLQGTYSCVCDVLSSQAYFIRVDEIEVFVLEAPTEMENALEDSGLLW